MSAPSTILAAPEEPVMHLTRRTLLGAAAATAATIRCASASAADPTAAGRAADLVSSFGGADAWRPLKALRIAAVHYEPQLRLPYDNLILMDLARPLMRFTGRSAEMDRRRFVTEAGGRRAREGQPDRDLTAEEVRSDLDWWEAHVYRTVWRLANGDPALTPRLHADGRLELYRPDGRRLLWYRQNLAGEPVCFGAFDAEAGTVLGPMAKRPGGLRTPVWTCRHDGTFRVGITAFDGLRDALDSAAVTKL